MGTLGTLAVSIVGDSQLDKTFDNINQKTQNLGKGMQDMGKRVSRAGGALTKYVTGPIVAAGAGITGLVMKTAAYGEELDITSSKLGTSVEGLQDWRYWAEQNGVESATLERAMGRLNQRIGEAVTEGGKYAEAFENLGVSLTDSQGNIRSTDDVMKDTIETIMAFEDPAVRSSKAADIFGTRVARDMMPALEDGSMSIEEAIQKMDEFGRVSEEEAKQSREFQDAVHDLKTEFMALVRDVGTDLIPMFTDRLLPAIRDNLIPAIERITEVGRNVVEWFQNLSPTVQKAIGVFVGLAAAAGPVLMIVGKLIFAIGTIVGVLSAKLAIIVAVIAGVIGIGVAVYNWIRGNEEAREKVSAAWERIRESLSEVWEALQELAQVVVERITEFWDAHGEKIMALLTGVWNQVVLIIETAINIVLGIIRFVTAIIQGDWEAAWEAMRDIGEAIWNFIAGTLENIFGPLVEWFLGLWDGIVGFFQNIWGRIAGAFSAGSDNARSILTDRFNAIRDFIAGVWEGIVDFLSGIWDSINDLTNGGAQKTLDRIMKVFKKVYSFVQEIWGAIQDFFGHWWKAIQALFRGDLEAMSGHINDAYRGVFDFIRNIWGRIRDFFTEVWRRIVDNTVSRVREIHDQVTSWFRRLQETVDRVWTGIRDGIRGTVNQIIGVIENMVNWSVRQINTFIGAVNNAISAINAIPGVNIGTIPTMGEVSIPRLHTGTQHFIPPGGGREGLALLERGEAVLSRGDRRGSTPETVNFERMFEGATFNVRSDEDIKKIAREIHGMFKSKSRSQGVPI